MRHRHLQNLYKEYLALLACAERLDIEKLKEAVKVYGGLIYAVDGLEPEGGQPQLWSVREVLTGTLIAAGWVTRVNKDTLCKFLEPVKALNLPLLATLSDKQPSLVLALEKTWKETPHQLCQAHYLTNAADPLYKVDQQMKIQLRKQVRAVAGPTMREAQAKVQKKATKKNNPLVITGLAAQPPKELDEIRELAPEKCIQGENEDIIGSNPKEGQDQEQEQEQEQQQEQEQEQEQEQDQDQDQEQEQEQDQDQDTVMAFDEQALTATQGLNDNPDDPVDDPSITTDNNSIITGISQVGISAPISENPDDSANEPDNPTENLSNILAPPTTVEISWEHRTEITSTNTPDYEREPAATDPVTGAVTSSASGSPAIKSASATPIVSTSPPDHSANASGAQSVAEMIRAKLAETPVVLFNRKSQPHG